MCPPRTPPQPSSLFTVLNIYVASTGEERSARRQYTKFWIFDTGDVSCKPSVELELFKKPNNTRKLFDLIVT